ncbi:MAG: glycoside hydrolase family 30 protein [Terriglobia bacterium]|jgi:glucosylceramidase
MRVSTRKAAWLLAAYIPLVARASAQQARIYVSSQAGDRLTAKPTLQFQADRHDSAAPTFTVDESTRYQQIDGFGASFLESGSLTLNTLGPAEQEKVLKALFDPQTGAAFSAMKCPLAGTDMMPAGPWYTYDDIPGDIGMKHFSIRRDLAPAGLITYIKRARQYGSFKLQAPMDFPPDWMLVEVGKQPDGRAALNVDSKYYDALALYYLRYLQEYEKHGVFIDYLSLFNERYTKITYPQIRDLLKDHVGPLFDRNHVRTQIQFREASTRGEAGKEYPTVLEDPDARKYVGSLAYHGYDFKNFDAIAELHRRYPGLPLWMTEICYVKRPIYEFSDGDFWGNQIASDLEAGASAWIYWNMILNDKGGPWLVSVVHGDPDPNIQHPVVIINPTTHEVTYTGLYYYLAHFSKFVRPGSVRIATLGSGEGLRCLAFKEPKGEVVAELLNSRKSDAQVTLRWQDREISLDLPAISISTVTWNPAVKPGT